MADKNFGKFSRNKPGSMVKGLSTKYNMNSKKTDGFETTDTNKLDTIVPDINVPIMKTNERKPSKQNRFCSKKWFQNAVKQTSLRIAIRILNIKKDETEKLLLPAKIKDLMELVM